MAALLLPIIRLQTQAALAEPSVCPSTSQPDTLLKDKDPTKFNLERSLQEKLFVKWMTLKLDYKGWP